MLDNDTEEQEGGTGGRRSAENSSDPGRLGTYPDDDPSAIVDCWDAEAVDEVGPAND